MNRRPLVAVLVAAASLVLPAAGQAAPAKPRLMTVKGVDAAGPARYDRVGVVQVGPKSAKHVLVLVPGTSAGAGYWIPDAQDLVKRMPDWQVWAIDRRENRLEDRSALDELRTGKRDGQSVFDYYLGWIGNSAVTTHYEPPTTEATAFAREWGMATAVGDLRNVIKQAKRGGRQVVLGGHSLGGSIAMAYASWDFGGTPGAKDLAGLVLVDGASSPDPISVADANERKTAIDGGSPFNDLTATGLPWAAGVFASVGAGLALREPNQPSLFQAWGPAPKDLLPPVPTTNRGQLGFAVDTETGPEQLALVQAHLGKLAATGDPRGWKDGGNATLTRTARAMNGVKGADGFSWFHPLRLSLDSAAVGGGRANPAGKALGVKATLGRRATLPIYAYETSLGKGRVLKSALAFAQRAKVPANQIKLVSRSGRDAHCDPIFDDYKSNDFLKTVIPFLNGTT